MTYIAGSTVGQYSVWAAPLYLYPYYPLWVEQTVHFGFFQSMVEPIPTLSPLALMFAFKEKFVFPEKVKWPVEEGGLMQVRQKLGGAEQIARNPR